MMYQFNQAVRLQGQNFKLGTQEVPSEVEADPFFLKMVEAGLIAEAETQVAPPPVTSFAERVLKLQERLKASKIQPKAEQVEEKHSKKKHRG